MASSSSAAAAPVPRRRIKVEDIKNASDDVASKVCLAVIAQCNNFMHQFRSEACSPEFSLSFNILRTEWLDKFRERNRRITIRGAATPTDTPKALSLTDTTFLAMAYCLCVMHADMRRDWNLKQVTELHSIVRMINHEYIFYGDVHMHRLENLFRDCCSAIVHVPENAETLSINENDLEDWEKDELDHRPYAGLTIGDAVKKLRDSRKKSTLMGEINRQAGTLTLSRGKPGDASANDAMQHQDEMDREAQEERKQMKRNARKAEAKRQREIYRKPGDPSDSEDDGDDEDSEEEAERQGKAPIKFRNCTIDEFRHKEQYYRVLYWNRYQFLTDCSRLFYQNDRISDFMSRHVVHESYDHCLPEHRAMAQALLLLQSEIEITKSIRNWILSIFYRLIMPLGAADAYHRVYNYPRAAVLPQSILNEECGSNFTMGVLQALDDPYSVMQTKPHTGTYCAREAVEWMIWSRHLQSHAPDCGFATDFLFTLNDLSENIDLLLSNTDRVYKRPRRPYVIKVFGKYYVQEVKPLVNNEADDPRPELYQCEDPLHAMATWSLLMHNMFDGKLADRVSVLPAINGIVNATKISDNNKKTQNDDDLFY